MPDSPATNTDSRAGDAELCAMCGRAIAGSAFCHFYHDGRRTTFCSPACAEQFLQRGASAANAGSFSDSPLTAFR